MAENSAVAADRSKMLLDSLPQLAAPQLRPQQKADLTRSSPALASSLSALPWPSTKPHRKLIVPADTATNPIQHGDRWPAKLLPRRHTCISCADRVLHWEGQRGQRDNPTRAGSDLLNKEERVEEVDAPHLV